MKRSATTATDDLSSAITTEEIIFENGKRSIPKLNLSEQLLQAHTPKVVAKLNNLIRLLEEYFADTKDYPALDRQQYAAKSKLVAKVIGSTDAAKKFYAERARIRDAVFAEGIFRQLDSPKLRTYVEFKDGVDSAADSFVCVVLALHWNTNNMVFVLDRAPIGRVSDVLAGRYANATIVVAGYNVQIQAGKTISSIMAIPGQQSGMHYTDIGQNNGLAVETEPYVPAHGGVYPILADYCERRIFHDRALSWIDDPKDEIRRWVRYLKFLTVLLPVALEEKWEVKTF